MPSSSPSQGKAARSKDGKSNGSNGRGAPAELKNAASSQVTGARPSDDDIARRAFEIYEREGRQTGTELQNWLKAEAELGGSKGH
jgi:hypothetical protein